MKNNYENTSYSVTVRSNSKNLENRELLSINPVIAGSKVLVSYRVAGAKDGFHNQGKASGELTATTLSKLSIAKKTISNLDDAKKADASGYYADDDWNEVRGNNDSTLFVIPDLGVTPKAGVTFEHAILSAVKLALTATYDGGTGKSGIYQKRNRQGRLARRSDRNSMEYIDLWCCVPHDGCAVPRRDS